MSERGGAAGGQPAVHRLGSMHRESATHGGMWDEEHFDMEEASEFLSPLDALAAKQDHADRRRRLVRNRWQLWWVLYKHPMLQGYRAHALAVMAARSAELRRAAAAGERPSVWRRAVGLLRPRKTPGKAAEQRAAEVRTSDGSLAGTIC